MDDAGPQSIFVVVSWDVSSPASFSILQLDTQEHNPEYAALLKPTRDSWIQPQSSFSSLKTQLNQKEYVAHLSRPQQSTGIIWDLTSSTSTAELYMVPSWDFGGHEIDVPLHGCIFSLTTKTIRQSKPPKAYKSDGHVVSLSGCIYFMSQPHCYTETPDPVFERYDPANDSWKTLAPFPDLRADWDTELGSEGRIVATAAWNDTILFFMSGRKIWAYDVERDRWYLVNVMDNQCYRIAGEAVVLENTIYALTTMSFNLVLALSIERKESGGDLVFKCSLRSRILLQDMKSISFEAACRTTRHLVHLGKDNFCLVRSCKLEDGFYDYQPIHLTNIKLKEENSMTVTSECVHMLRILDDQQFEVRHCFSLPECKTTALKQGERLFDLDPYPEGLEKVHFTRNIKYASHVYAIPSFAPKASTLGDGAASERSNTDEEGHSILLRNLPSDATFRQLEKQVKKFGLIKEDGIQVMIDDTGLWFAIVEFERATSKQRAIKTSAIIIKGCRVEIEEKRRDDLALVDCNRTSGSSSSGKNKFKNHGEVSRSKTMQKQKKKSRHSLSCGHLPAPIMDDDAGPQSVFVVVSHKYEAPYFSSILQLETPQINNHEYATNLAPEQIKRTQVNEKEYVARFSQPQGFPSNSWLFSPPTSSTEDLYMVPRCTYLDYYIHVGAPLRGYKVNFRNGMCRPIMPPRASKYYGHVVNQGGHIYFMAHPDWYYDTPDPVFECYDPDENKWNALEPFPDHAVHQLRCSIVATAVWDDTILYNMGGCKIWAYNVHKNKWYTVNVEDNRCYSIAGEAVVLENTIYALTDPEKTLDLVVLALSIEREKVNGDYVYICALRSEISVPGKLEDVKAHWITRHLVHLGKDNFCLVQSCELSGVNRYQPIQLTSIKLMGERSMTVTGVCVYEVEIQGDEQFQAKIQHAEQIQAEDQCGYGFEMRTPCDPHPFHEDIAERYCDQVGMQHDQQFEVRLCFSLPDCKTTALKQGERLFELDPFPEDYASKIKDKTEGNCICVRNVPPDATFRQLENDLKNKLGPVKRAGIQVIINNTGNLFAIVEFESATSKQFAIEESPIMIGDGFALGDCNRTSGSSSSGKNKFKNHGEVSLSKTTCGGHNVGEGGGNQLRRSKRLQKYLHAL